MGITFLASTILVINAGYERLTDDIECVTGRPAMTLQRYATQNPGKFGG